MGCGKSKLDQVATTNTLLRRKESNNAGDVKQSSESIKNINTSNIPQETSKIDDVKGNNVIVTTSMAAQPQEVVLQQQEQPKKQSEKVEKHLGGVALFNDKDVKEIKENRISHKEEEEEEEEEGEINIEEIITEGLSGKSEYNTPRHGDFVKDQDLLTECLIKAAAENEKYDSVEKNLVKEAELATSFNTEAQASKPVEEEENKE